MSPSDPARPIRVGIGLIERAGSFLIRLRPEAPGSPMPGYWEFPGGKCEGDESPEAATSRECAEETGLRIVLQGRRRVVRHRYPHGLVELHYFDAAPAEDVAEPDPGSGFRWVAAADLPRLRFPDANGPILLDLARGAGSTGIGFPTLGT